MVVSGSSCCDSESSRFCISEIESKIQQRHEALEQHKYLIIAKIISSVFCQNRKKTFKFTYVFFTTPKTTFHVLNELERTK